MKNQLSTIASPETRQAYTRLREVTGLSLTDLFTAAVPLLERHFRQAELVAGYIRLDRWGDLGPGAICPECDQPFAPPLPAQPVEGGTLDNWSQPGEMLPWIAVRANGATCAPICSRCATSE